MEYDFISAIGNAIDNVYNNYAENSARRTVVKLVDDKMTITFMTVINIAREQDMHYQMKNLNKEANDMIKSRLSLIKQQFKQSSGRALKAKKVDACDSIETLTVSAYSPHRSLKFSHTVSYEVA